MFKPVHLQAGKRGLEIRSPVINAAGVLGFSQEAQGLVPLDALGAFITNPISSQPRSPANDSRAHRLKYGWIIHSGHPNPGLKAARRHFQRAWAAMKVPVIVHLIAQDSQELERMILTLESETAIDAIEIGLELKDLAALQQIIRVCQRSELPVFVRLPLNAPTEAFLRAAGFGAVALSIGPPRASTLAPDGEWISGRMYGPALMPLALAKVQGIRAGSHLPILASGGIHSPEHIRTILAAGANAVQLDYGLWAEPELAAFSP